LFFWLTHQASWPRRSGSSTTVVVAALGESDSTDLVGFSAPDWFGGAPRA